MSVILGENKLSNIIKTDAGTGGTTNYVDLDNKPSINGVELVGDKTSADLGLETQQIDAYTKDETNAAIASAITGKADINYVDNQLNLKADKVNTYTKSEVDSAISNNLTIINNKLNNKADKSETYTKDETVQVIQSNIVGKADISYVDSELSTKADKSDTYTKTEIDNLLDNPTITGDTYPIGAIAPYAGTTVPQNWLLCDGREVSRTTYSELFAAIGTVWGAGDGSTSFNLPNLKNRVTVGAGEDYDLAETGGEDVKVESSETGRNMPPYVGSYYIIKAKQSAGVIATVVDTLASTSTTDALSAKQGKVLNDKFYPITLYNNPDGAAVNIVLSDDVQNYDYIEVTVRQESYTQSEQTQKLYNPNNRKIHFNFIRYEHTDVDKVQIFGANLTFSGKNVTYSDGFGYVLGKLQYGTVGNSIRIIRVLGYNY